MRETRTTDMFRRCVALIQLFSVCIQFFFGKHLFHCCWCCFFSPRCITHEMCVSRTYCCARCVLATAARFTHAYVCSLNTPSGYAAFGFFFTDCMVSFCMPFSIDRNKQYENEKKNLFAHRFSYFRIQKEIRNAMPDFFYLCRP